MHEDDNNVIPLVRPPMVAGNIKPEGDNEDGLTSQEGDSNPIALLARLFPRAQYVSAADLTSWRDSLTSSAFIHTQESVTVALDVSQTTLRMMVKAGWVVANRDRKQTMYAIFPELILEAQDKEDAAEAAKRDAKLNKPDGRGRPRKPIIKRVYRCTDMGNARRMIDKGVSDYLKHCSTAGWCFFDGEIWTVGIDEKVANRQAGNLATWISEEADEDDTELLKFASKCEGSGTIRNAVTMFKQSVEVDTDCRLFDKDPWLLNVQNGHIDLRDNSFKPYYLQEHMATKKAGFEYDAEADCPRWLDFLSYAFDGDQEMIKFLQQFAGYALTGYAHIEQFLFLLGEPSTGKNTFVDRIRKIAGTYGEELRSEEVMHKVGDGTQALAKLRGARVVAVEEASGTQSWNEGLIARMVGGGGITARFLYENETTFQPVLKLFMHANDPPQVRNPNSGLFRRLREVHFKNKLGSRVIDCGDESDLKTYLDKHELSGIANWALTGWVTVRSTNEIETPEKILFRADEIRAMADLFGRFIAETFTPSAYAHPIPVVPTLWERYKSWWANYSNQPIQHTAMQLARKLANYKGIDCHRNENGDWCVFGQDWK